MARPNRPHPGFAGSVVLSGAFHGALLALLAGSASRGQLAPSSLYEVDIEPEPPLAPICAFRQKYLPSRDPAGRAMAGTTAPFHVTFVR